MISFLLSSQACQNSPGGGGRGQRKLTTLMDGNPWLQALLKLSPILPLAFCLSSSAPRRPGQTHHPLLFSSSLYLSQKIFVILVLLTKMLSMPPCTSMNAFSVPTNWCLNMFQVLGTQRCLGQSESLHSQSSYTTQEEIYNKQINAFVY